MGRLLPLRVPLCRRGSGFMGFGLRNPKHWVASAVFAEGDPWGGWGRWTDGRCGLRLLAIGPKKQFKRRRARRFARVCSFGLKNLLYAGTGRFLFEVPWRIKLKKARGRVATRPAQGFGGGGC